MPEAYNFIKKENLTQVFSCDFFEIFKKIFSYKAPMVVASKSNSTYSSIVLENINSDIPIALNLTASPKVKQAEENQAANKLSTKKNSSFIPDTGRYIDEKYDRTNLKQENKKTIKEVIDFLKSEVYLREVSEKKN